MEIKPKFEWRKSIVGPTLVVLAIFVVLNMISRDWFGRMDLTKEKMYTLSESSRSVVQKIDDLMTVRVYFSENLPGEYGNNRRFLQDILEEYAAFSRGNIKPKFFVPSESEDLEQAARTAGIQQLELKVVENDKIEVKRVFMGLVIEYQDEDEVIPFIQKTTALEYEITSKIKKLVDDDNEAIAIAQFTSSNRTNQGIRQFLGERYQIQDIDMTNPIPSGLGVLIMNGVSVSDSLDTNQLQNLKDYITSGGNMLISQGRVDVALNQQIGFFQGTNIQSNIFDFLNEYGVNIEENLVLDKQNGQINIPQRVGPFQSWSPLDYPFFPTVNTFDDSIKIVNGLERVQFNFCSEITIDSLAQNVTPIMFSSNNSATMAGYYNLYPNTKESPAPIFNQLNEGKKILGVIIETITGGQIILLSESDFFTDPVDQTLARVFPKRQKDNYTFVVNSIDFLMGDEELIALRSREITNRPLLSEAEGLDKNAKSRWKWFNIVLPTALVVGFGFFRLRRSKARSRLLEEIYG